MVRILHESIALFGDLHTSPAGNGYMFISPWQQAESTVDKEVSQHVKDTRTKYSLKYLYGTKP